MSHKQYIRYCLLTEIDPLYYQQIQYPHPYLLIWLECRRHGNPLTGAASLPEPEKGWLDQDAELMLAFEILEEIQEAREEEQKKKEQMKAQVKELFRNQ